MSTLHPLALPSGPAVLDALPEIERALAGEYPVVPYAANGPVPGINPHEAESLPAGLTAAIGTSGSTGRPKRALLTAANLLASVNATHSVLGGPGAWLLTMPAHHIAGFQVLCRSIVAGVRPVVVEQAGGFTAHGFVQAVESMAAAPHESGRRYTAMVPTQLSRLLDDHAGLEALRTFDGVLVGGSATPGTLAEAARSAGVRLALTYGMSETAGGCVYDGVAIPGAQVHLDNDRHIVLGGEQVAHGYLGEPDLSADAFSVDGDGVRWFRTDDLGHVADDGSLVIDGRADDVINTGGLKITPGVVEDAILRHVPEVADVVVLGRTDPEWGEVVCAAITLLDPISHVSTREVREELRGILPDAALPRQVIVLPALPLRGPGKPDLAAIRMALAERSSRHDGPVR